MLFVTTRGSAVTARLANLYADRFSAFGFLAYSYNAPAPDFDYQKSLVLTKQVFGYELYGYWRFFSEEGADKVCEKHVSTSNSPFSPLFLTRTFSIVGLFPQSGARSGSEALDYRFRSARRCRGLHH